MKKVNNPENVGLPENDDGVFLTDEQKNSLNMQLQDFRQSFIRMNIAVILNAALLIIFMIIKEWKYFQISWLKYAFTGIILANTVVIIILGVIAFKATKKLKKLSDELDR